MKTLKLFRTFNEGVQNFRRDKWLTAVTVMVMSLALYLMGIFFFSGFGILNVMKSIEDRINISVDFDYDVSEERIVEIKKEIEKIKEVKFVNYISREDALKNFIEENKDDEIIMRALEESKDVNPDENPFYASLVITARDVDYYDEFDEYLRKEYEEELVSSNYSKNKDTMGELHKFILFIRNASLVLGAILIIISILLNLNTIRMSLYANRKEFEIMRLVGASNLYVKLPTVFEGLLYGVTSALITVVGLIVTIYGADYFIISKILPNSGISEFYTKYILEISLIVLALGAVLGIISSYISIRRYLEK